MQKPVMKSKGVTVISAAADSKSMFPPLCHILKALCYSSERCSVGPMQTSVTTALGVRGIKYLHRAVVLRRLM